MTTGDCSRRMNMKIWWTSLDSVREMSALLLRTFTMIGTSIDVNSVLLVNRLYTIYEPYPHYTKLMILYQTHDTPAPKRRALGLCLRRRHDRSLNERLIRPWACWPRCYIQFRNLWRERLSLRTDRQRCLETHAVMLGHRLQGEFQRSCSTQ